MSHPGIDAIRSLLGERATEPQTIQERRDSLEALAGAVPSPDGVTVEALTVAGRPAERSTPDRVDGAGTVLYLHGGAYVSGSLNTHRALAGRLALATARPVVALDYRLGPEHPFPAAVDDAVAAAVELAASGEPFAVAGDSAGGGLALATLVALRDRGDVPPVGRLADLAVGRPHPVGRDLRQPGRRRPHARAARRSTEAAGEYLGAGDPTDPLASPMMADLSGLPPVRIDVGDAEVLLDDSRRHRPPHRGGRRRRPGRRVARDDPRLPRLPGRRWCPRPTSASPPPAPSSPSTSPSRLGIAHHGGGVVKDLVGKVAVVTGAGSGIGRALAQRLAAEGMRVALADVDTAALGDTGRLLVEAGIDPGDVLAQPTDVRLEAEVDALADRVFREWGQVDLLCNNAGVFVGGFLWERPAADLEFVLGVNLWGILHGIRAFLPRMIAASGTPATSSTPARSPGCWARPTPGPTGSRSSPPWPPPRRWPPTSRPSGRRSRSRRCARAWCGPSIADDVDAHRPAVAPHRAHRRPGLRQRGRSSTSPPRASTPPRWPAWWSTPSGTRPSSCSPTPTTPSPSATRAEELPPAASPLGVIFT